MKNIVKKIIFRNDTIVSEQDKKEEQEVYVAYAHAAIFAFIASLLALIYDVLAHGELTGAGIPSLIIIMVMGYYLLYWSSRKEIYTHSGKSNFILIALSSISFFSLFTLCNYLFGESITLFNLIVYLVVG